jgi:hypothetical protein
MTISSGTLEMLVRCSRALYDTKQELARYQSERWLHDEAVGPWIAVTVNNHPTYLSEFKVSITQPGARKQIKDIMLGAIKHRIKTLELELDKLLKGIKEDE